MTTYNTGNPVGSAAPKDLYDNAENLDTAIHTGEKTWVDRLGNTRTSWAGATGYQILGDYAGGIEITERNQIVRESGEYWRLKGSVDLPYTTTGTWVGDDENRFLSVGDAVLRSELALDGGVFLVKDAVASVANVTELRALTGLQDGQVIRVVGTLKAGLFNILAGDYSAQVASDPAGIEWVPLDSNPSGSTIVARRQYGQAVNSNPPIRAEWAGADPAATGADNYTAIQAALSYASGDVELDSDVTVSTVDGSLSMTLPGQELRGKGSIKAADSNNNLIVVSGDDCKVTLDLEGDGTFTADKAVASDVRISLIWVTGNNVRVSSLSLTNGHQNFVCFNGVSGGEVVGVDLYGGITTYDALTDTGYQGIRVVSSSGVKVSGCRVYEKGGGKCAEAVYLGPTGAGEVSDCSVSGNIVYAAWDHGVYANIVRDCGISFNIVTSDSVAIVCGGQDSSLNNYAGNTVCWNKCFSSGAAAPGDGTSGIQLRDANNFVVSHNEVTGYPRGITLQRVTFSGLGVTMDGNTLTENTVREWTDNGILVSKGGDVVGSISHNCIAGNTLVSASAASGLRLTASAIGFAVSQESSANIALSNAVSRNIIVGSGDTGISMQYHTRARVESNIITNPSLNASSVTKSGILFQNCLDSDVRSNTIFDEAGDMRSGIDGNSSTVSSRFKNNSVSGNDPAFAPLRRLQQASNDNTFDGNSTGSNSLDGIATLGAAASTTVNCDQVNTGVGYTSRIVLHPANAAAAQLVASVGVYGSGLINRTSFDIDTGDGTAAAGTEEFFYRVVQ